MITKFVFLRVELEKDDPDFAEKAAGRVYNMHGSCDVLEPSLKMPLGVEPIDRGSVAELMFKAYSAGRLEEAAAK